MIEVAHVFEPRVMGAVAVRAGERGSRVREGALMRTLQTLLAIHLG